MARKGAKNGGVMQRKEFLRRLGLAGLSVPLLNACDDPEKKSGGCGETDSESDGPYPLYNSRGSLMQRVDITDGKQGTPLQMTITVKNINDNCNVVSDARVDIWHCDKDGYYSGYTNSGYLGSQNNSSLVFCRGYQLTDANGVVTFQTIYPGWYAGRVTHIHVQVTVASVLKLTSQIAFPEDINTEVYNTSLYVSHGQNPTKNTTDNIIRDSLSNELAKVTGSSGGYNLEHTIFVSA